MAASGAKVGYGTTLVVGSTTLSELESIGGPSGKRTMIDVTHMESDNACREFIGGLVDGGQVTVSANFIKAKYTAMDTLLQGGAIQTCVLTLSNSLGTCTFSGLVEELSSPVEIDKQTMYDLTIKVTGKAVWA